MAAVVLLWPSGRSSSTPHGGPATSGAPLHPSGRLLVTDDSGVLGFTDAEGGHYAKVRGATSGFGAIPSPDGRSLLSVTGTLVRIRGDRATSRLVVPTSLSSRVVAAASPWADHGRHVIMLSVASTKADVTSVTTSRRQTSSLGDHAADATGDPQQNAALVAVAGTKLVGHGKTAQMPARRLEHRRPGMRKVLATTTRLARIVGFPAHEPYALRTHYSPDGRMVAVVLDQLNPGSDRHGIIVLTRAGRAVFHRAGPDTSVWSHDGSRLAYWRTGADRLHIVDLSGSGRHPSVTLRLPRGARTAESCLWSPEDSILACDDPDHGVRSLLEVATDRVERVSLDDSGRVPLAWLSTRAAS